VPSMGKIRVRDAEYEVDITLDGIFWVVVNNEKLSDSSLEGLRKKMIVATKRPAAKVSVPFVSVEGVRGVATGIHGSTRNILVRWENGKTEQLNHWSGLILDDLTPQENEERHDLRARYDNASKALKKFQSDHRFDLLRAVQDAVQIAVKEATKDVAD